MWQDKEAQLLQAWFLFSRDLIRVHTMTYYLIIITKSIATYLYDESEVVSSHRQKNTHSICKRGIVMLFECCLWELVCVCFFLKYSERPSKSTSKGKHK